MLRAASPLAILCLAGCADLAAPGGDRASPILWPDDGGLTYRALFSDHRVGLLADDEPLLLAADSQASYEQAWARWGHETPPDIDFANETAIFVAMEQGGGDRIAVHGIEARNGTVFVHILHTLPGERCAYPAAIHVSRVLVAVEAFDARVPLRAEFTQQDGIPCGASSDA